MSKLQEIFLNNCNFAVEQHNIEHFNSRYLLMAIIMLIIAPVTIFVNTVTIYVFWKEKRMATLTDILLFFLAVTDIIGGLVAMPLFAVESILRAQNTKRPCSIFLISKLAQVCSFDITIVTSILIVLDRYFSIFQPYRYNCRRHQTSSAALVVVSLWCVSIAICLLSIITTKLYPAIVSTIVAYVCYVCMSILVHLKVFIRARHTHREIAVKRCHFERNNCKTDSWYRIKGARITAVMFCGIVLCYVPQTITGILKENLNYSRSVLIAFYWTTALNLSHSIVNPLVYIWQLKWFRKALWKVTSVADNSYATGMTSWDWLAWYAPKSCLFDINSWAVPFSFRSTEICHIDAEWWDITWYASISSNLEWDC